MSDSVDDPEEVGPVRRVVREELDELDAIQELLDQAHKEKAAGRIEELHVEVARRLEKIRKRINE